MRQIVQLWEHIYGSLPVLLISTKPMARLDGKTEHCVYIPFADTSFDAAAETIAETRRITYETLSHIHREGFGNSEKQSWGKRLGDSIELKPGIFGFRLDLRRLLRM